MFAYCGNNPISRADNSGNFFFTALGVFTGFVAGVATAALSNLVSSPDNQTDIFQAGLDGAVGGAIAGAGVDAGLLIVGSCGVAVPTVALATGVAFVAGGLGNVYTTYAASDGTASDEELSLSFVVGGFFNVVSLATSAGCIAANVDELIYLGQAGLRSNAIVGTAIGLSTGIATAIGSQIFVSCNE